MIEVSIKHVGSGVELGVIRIENVGGDEFYADYSIQFGVDRIGAVGTHQRGINRFPRTRYNVLALLLQALNTLEPRELELEDEVDPSDLARGLRRGVQALSSKAFRRLRDH